MTGFRKPLQVLACLVVAGLGVLAGAVPALSAPPFPPGAEATALVSGTPLVKVVCPPGSPGAVTGGNSTRLGVSVGFPAGARCTPQSASADGLYAISGVTPPLPGTLRFSSSCQNSTGQNGTAVDVPAGTNVTGIGVVPQQTTITSLNTVVTFPGGTTAIVNEVIVEPTAVVRNAIRITSGPNSGTIIGQVICGVRYPLAVDPPGAGTAADLAAPSAASSDGGGIALWVVLGVGVLLISQLALGRHLWQRRKAEPSA
ncbi:MAG: hypothetical protein ACRD2W_19830 [Acidimicrobiales bacterium]